MENACSVVVRTSEDGLEVLAFRHPSAGKQFVKGTIEEGETPQEAKGSTSDGCFGNVCNRSRRYTVALFRLSQLFFA
ncbi:hypothetical protein CAP48_04060 [Advenella sp. S44]|nr:hypothetical protein CAP48_04060 [Advenella sp. S44]